MNKFFIFLIMSILLVSSVSAGTLLSGGSFEVESNNPNLNGQVLVGLWSTTPLSADQLIVKNAVIEGALIEDDVIIDFSPAKFEQVFETVRNEEERLVTAQYVDLVVYRPYIGFNARENCVDRLENDIIPNDYNNRQYYERISPIVGGNNIMCTYEFVLEKEQKGYIAPVYKKGTFYSSSIDIDGRYTLNLEVNENSNGADARIENVAYAEITGFSDWFRASLSDSNIWAYHGRNDLGSSNWKPFFDTVGDVNLKQFSSELRSILYSTVGTKDARSQDMRETVDSLNREINRLIGKSSTPPSVWDDAGVLNQIRYSGNEIIVPLDKVTKNAEIQIILKGDAFGLYLPEGEPKIISLDSTVTFEEEQGGIVNYVVKNIGGARGAFTVSGSCDSSVVAVERDELTLNAQESRSGSLRLSARTDITEPIQNVGCNFVLSGSGKTDERNFMVNVEVKQQCSQGEETDPFLRGDNYIVQVKDTLCNVIQEKTCPVSGSQFQFIDGTWKCLQTGTGDNDQLTCDDGFKIVEIDGKRFCEKEQGEFNLSIFIIAVVIGMIGAIWAFVLIPPLPRFGWVKWVVALIIFVALVIAVSFIANSVFTLFSF